MNIPINKDALLRYIVSVHFVFTSMVHLASWLPMSYTLSQMTIIVLGVWAIVHRESVIQVELLMVIKCFSIVLDTIAIGMYFQLGQGSYYAQGYNSYFVLSVFFAIFLLILKPAMLLLLNKVRQDRAGDRASPTFGAWGFDARPVPGYQPVDEQQVTNHA